MFMSWKMECSIQRGGAELNGTFQLSTNEHSHHCTNEKHSLFVLFNIQVDLCHFDWKIQLSKQTKRRPTIFNCRIQMLVLVILLILFLAVTLLRYKDTRRQWCFYSAFSFHPKSTVSDSACNGTFICYHVTDNPPIKWQGYAWVLYNMLYPVLYQTTTICI